MHSNNQVFQCAAGGMPSFTGALAALGQAKAKLSHSARILRNALSKSLQLTPRQFHTPNNAVMSTAKRDANATEYNTGLYAGSKQKSRVKMAGLGDKWPPTDSSINGNKPVRLGNSAVISLSGVLAGGLGILPSSSNVRGSKRLGFHAHHADLVTASRFATGWRPPPRSAKTVTASFSVRREDLHQPRPAARPHGALSRASKIRDKPSSPRDSRTGGSSPARSPRTAVIPQRDTVSTVVSSTAARPDVLRELLAASHAARGVKLLFPHFYKDSQKSSTQSTSTTEAAETDRTESPEDSSTLSAYKWAHRSAFGGYEIDGKNSHGRSSQQQIDSSSVRAQNRNRRSPNEGEENDEGEDSGRDDGSQERIESLELPNVFCRLFPPSGNPHPGNQNSHGHTNQRHNGHPNIHVCFTQTVIGPITSTVPNTNHALSLQVDTDSLQQTSQSQSLTTTSEVAQTSKLSPQSPPSKTHSYVLLSWKQTTTSVYYSKFELRVTPAPLRKLRKGKANAMQMVLQSAVGPAALNSPAAAAWLSNSLHQHPAVQLIGVADSSSAAAAGTTTATPQSPTGTSNTPGSSSATETTATTMTIPKATASHLPQQSSVYTEASTTAQRIATGPSSVAAVTGSGGVLASASSGTGGHGEVERSTTWGPTATLTWTPRSSVVFGPQTSLREVTEFIKGSEVSLAEGEGE